MAAAKKKRARKAPKRENLSDQIVVRVKPSTRERLEAHAEKHALRGVGEAVRHVLESAGRW